MKESSRVKIDINIDMPSGFYIYNEDTYPISLGVTDDTEYLILDWNQLSNHKSITKGLMT